MDNTQIWRVIPPEEKIEAMAQAHSRGIMTSLCIILLGCTLAVGFKFSLLMWGSFLLAPLIFQMTAGKAWRDIRPRIMLEYLAARSAARRYAFAAGSKELDLNLMFRAQMVLEKPESEDGPGADLQRRLQEATDQIREVQVWVALFKDTVVLMSEEPGGAKLQFSHMLDDKLVVAGDSESESESDYSEDRRVAITAQDKLWNGRTFKLQSKYPAALVVLEKVMQDRIKNYVKIGAVAAELGGGLLENGEPDPYAAGGF